MFDSLGMTDAAAVLVERTARTASGIPPIPLPTTQPARLPGSRPWSLTSLPGLSIPRLAVIPALAPVLPEGLRRGSTVSVSGSVSLVLAMLAAASADGSWCALVGMPAISAEAAHDHGIDVSRLPMVPCPGSSWVTVVGALLDAVDVVVARAPSQLADGDIRRLAARARSRGAVFVPFLTDGGRWPHADVRLGIEGGDWSGIGQGYGRLRQRRVTVTARGRGQAARDRSALLWLPTASGGAEAATPPAAGVLAGGLRLAVAR
jgi:hypothetical protein